MTQPDLYQAIHAFDIDGGPAQLSFARRLARENGWSLGYSERVVTEYKRFVYLCMAAGHPCTPSDEVDQAWHLHMLYTESYWKRLCGEVLPRPLSHGPTKGGHAEDAKFDDWYVRTKDSYRREFGSEPTSDIWPPSEIRFGLAPHFRRVNTRDHWVVPKRPVALGAAGLVLAVIGIGCQAAGEGVGMLGPILMVGVILLVVGSVIVWAVRAGGRSKRAVRGYDASGCGASGCGSDGKTETSDSGCGSSGCASSGCGGGCGGGD